jgi:DNA-binding ferritin-like protein (Dps family)
MDSRDPSTFIDESLFQTAIDEMDVEDVVDLIEDCYLFIEQLLKKNQPAWVIQQGLQLQNRIAEVLQWQKLH